MFFCSLVSGECRRSPRPDVHILFHHDLFFLLWIGLEFVIFNFFPDKKVEDIFFSFLSYSPALFSEVICALVPKFLRFFLSR